MKNEKYVQLRWENREAREWESLALSAPAHGSLGGLVWVSDEDEDEDVGLGFGLGFGIRIGIGSGSPLPSPSAQHQKTFRHLSLGLMKIL